MGSGADSMEMLLPGGIGDAQGLRRDFAFKPLTGGVELAMAECSMGGTAQPVLVTGLLSAVLEHIGGRPAGRDDAANLCVGDRQYLMLRLAAYLGRDSGWLTAACRSCDARFDFFVELSKLPVKATGDGYPLLEVPTANGLCAFRLPTGSDQEVIATLSDDKQALGLLLNRCLMTVGGKTPQAGISFSVDDMASIEAAMEAIAPEVPAEVLALCPECAAENIVPLDPCAFVTRQLGGILTEIHTLASCYHWGEEEILSMPRGRRQQYLALIDRARGMQSQSSGQAR